MTERIQKKLNVILTVVVVIALILCSVVVVRGLAEGEATLFGCRIYYVLTGSMEPTYPAGSNVVVRKVDPDTLEVGDVITFHSRENAILGEANTHRIIKILEEDGTRYFVTQGDANTAKDPIHVREDDIIGKVIFKINFVGLNRFLGFLRTPMGFVTVIVFPCMILLWMMTRDLKLAVKEAREENISQEQAILEEAARQLLAEQKEARKNSQAEDGGLPEPPEDTEGPAERTEETGIKENDNTEAETGEAVPETETKETEEKDG